jgi:predicted acyl esterase
VGAGGRRRLVAAAVAALLVASIGAARAADGGADPNAFEFSESFVSSPIDAVPLHVKVFRPQGFGLDAAHRTPVLLEGTPYHADGGDAIDGLTPLNDQPSHDNPYGIFTTAQAFAHGYSYVEFEPRGYGASGGCHDLGGRKDRADFRAVLTWAASQPWSTGSVGTLGASYSGWVQSQGLASLAESGPLPGWKAAIVGDAITGYDHVYTNDVKNTGQGTAWGEAWFGYDATGIPSASSPPEQFLNAASGAAGTCVADHVAGVNVPDRTSAYWQERDLVALLAQGKGDVPTLYNGGWNDWNAKPPEGQAIWRSLAGPRRGVFGPVGHTGLMGFVAANEAMAWFDHWLKGAPAPKAPEVQILEADGRWRGERQWPPSDAEPHAFALLPGTYTDGPGNYGDPGRPFTGTVVSILAAPAKPVLAQAPTGSQGAGAWTVTQPLPYDVRIAGAPVLRADAATSVPIAHIVGLVYDIDADGNARLVTRGVRVVPATGPAAFALYPVDYRLAAGHRIGVLISGADDEWFEPGVSNTPVEVRSASITLPTLTRARTRFLDLPAVASHLPDTFPVDPAVLATRTTTVPLPPRAR